MRSIITCPECQMEQFMVCDSRKKDNGIIIRKKKCANCGHKITTYEIDSEDLDELTALSQNLTMLKDTAQQILEL